MNTEKPPNGGNIVELRHKVEALADKAERDIKRRFGKQLAKVLDDLADPSKTPMWEHVNVLKQLSELPPESWDHVPDLSGRLHKQTGKLFDQLEKIQRSSPNEYIAAWKDLNELPVPFRELIFTGSKAETARDHEEHGLTSMRTPLPTPKPEAASAANRDRGRPTYKSAAAMYRQYYKKHGRDPDDPGTAAPSMKVDIALMKRLFPEGGVPEKTLRSIRHDAWGDRIRRGRPSKMR